MNKEIKPTKYKIASILRCLDVGRDRIAVRIIQPFLFAITFSTWLKVYFPDLALVQGIFYLISLGLFFIIFYIFSGYVWQKIRLFHEEQKFDILRNPIIMEMHNNIKDIKNKIR